MKRLLIILLACFWLAGVFAQQNPVVMRINGREILRSEFEQQYHRYAAKAGVKLSAKEYAELFIIDKLKIAAAETAKIDTIQSFRKQLADYYSRLSMAYLTDEHVLDSCARDFYEKLKANPRSGQVQIMQIVKFLPQTITPNQLRAVEMQMDSICQIIKRQPDVDFMKFVNQYSDDKQAQWIGGGQTTSEIENRVFSMQQGEISQPILTPEGIHILKVVGRKELPSFELLRDTLISRLTRHNEGLDIGSRKRVEKLKSEYSYIADKTGIDELLLRGETDKTLFTLAGQSYTGVMFKRFAQSRTESVKRQLDAFIAKSLLDYEYKNIGQKNSGLAARLQEYRDHLLRVDITRQKIDVPAFGDKAGLMAYFQSHKSNFDWEHPRFKGILLHCVDKKIAKQAKKLIKKAPESEWADIIRKTFNTGGSEKVMIEQGLFANGDNKYIDKLVFKKGEFEPIVSNPFTVVVGRKQKGPDDYREVLDRVQKDYRNYLDTCWIEELRASGKVEINQEVLKTVNNI